MTAGTYNFTIEGGTTPNKIFTWLVNKGQSRVDLTGYTARMDIRKDDDTLLLSLTTANGRIALQSVADDAGLTQGVIALVLTPTDTTNLVASAGAKVVYYDLLLTASTGRATRLLQGTITLSKAVSHV